MVKGVNVIRATEALQMNGRGKPYVLGGLVAALLGAACWFFFGGDKAASSSLPGDQIVRDEPDKAPAERNVEKVRKPQRSQDKREIIRKTAEPRRPTQIIEKAPRRSEPKRTKKKRDPVC
jgi:hypothetical protein